MPSFAIPHAFAYIEAFAAIFRLFLDRCVLTASLLDFVFILITLKGYKTESCAPVNVRSVFCFSFLFVSQIC